LIDIDTPLKSPTREDNNSDKGFIEDRGQGAGAGNAGNRTVTCLDDTSGIITDSFCSTILIAIQSNTFR
jgi:hypothetical protein